MWTGQIEGVLQMLHPSVFGKIKLHKANDDDDQKCEIHQKTPETIQDTKQISQVGSLEPHRKYSQGVC